MKRFNNKGYMLVEIILAFALAFGMVYFITTLTIKMKNRSDDEYVKTLVATDKTIVNNKLMKLAKENGSEFDCAKLKIDEKTIKYDDEVLDTISDYASLGAIYCFNNGTEVNINIPININQVKNDDFNIDFSYRYGLIDVNTPTCSIEYESDRTFKFNAADDNGLVYYGFNESYSGDNSDSKTVTTDGETIFYVKDIGNNTMQCKLTVIKADETYTCIRNASWIVTITGSCSCWNAIEGKRTGSGTCTKSGTCSCSGSSEPYSSTCATSGYYNCPSGSTKNGTKCTLSEQTSCDSSKSWSIDSTNYNCSSGTLFNTNLCYIID